jgi:hypothetical protein
MAFAPDILIHWHVCRDAEAPVAFLALDRGNRPESRDSSAETEAGKVSSSIAHLLSGAAVMQSTQLRISAKSRS